MNSNPRTTDSGRLTISELPMPRLTDDVAVQIYDFLYQFLNLFEARYGAQIDRFYANLGEDNELDVNNLDPPS